ncbi:methionine biosynthesis protein MetW [Cutibacterium sp. V947]|uniref:methionine biosynthesis protein MetW n=1 Tax=unclassified Cutibacterium TaxID=2649671 RepID=UPI003EE301EB
MHERDDAVTIRPDQRIITSLVPSHSRVLDLGCGDGSLLRHLITTRDCLGTGVELDQSSLVAAMSTGVPVLGMDLNEDLGEFHDDSYDVVILSQTLQAVVSPDVVLAEMARIGTLLILLVPNFVYWRNRLKIIGGRMPTSHDLPYSWHDTPNQSYSGVADLEDWFAEFNLETVERVCLDGRGRPSRVASAGPNLLAGSTIHVLRSHWAEPGTGRSHS